uniref:Uncharacterized protein n=1 Tax=Panagrolaimus superbus TaxID=310955 RepID=A0A914ZGT7_9BILA
MYFLVDHFIILSSADVDQNWRNRLPNAGVNRKSATWPEESQPSHPSNHRRRDPKAKKKRNYDAGMDDPSTARHSTPASHRRRDQKET